MAKLHLHIFRDGNQTRTKIGKDEGPDKIVFHNHSTTEVLQVDFVPANVIKDNSGAFIGQIVVPADGEKRVSFDAAEGAEVKYTVKIGTAAAEDPIIIID